MMCCVLDTLIEFKSVIWQIVFEIRTMQMQVHDRQVRIPY